MLRPLLVGLFLGGLFLGGLSASAAAQGAPDLQVGPGHRFDRIEDALVKARVGSIIAVHPRRDGKPYEQVALFVTEPNVTIRAVPGRDGKRVVLSGRGFDYSGVGRTPRAIVQFNPGADGCRLEGFELRGARNGSHNGAGVRINGANQVTVARCTIHGNDMGIMSNGDGTAARAVNQVITHCHLHHNGTAADPGQNHNLYLGGTSVTLRFCEVSHSVTGHNVKSRAHHTRVEYCYIHDSGNREFDLVDATDTARPGSHAVLLGNVIVKAPKMPGNRAVIHFGQDGGGAHHGTLHLAFNTIVTRYRSPVVQLTAPRARARLVGNIVWDANTSERTQILVRATRGARLESATGERNWLAAGFAKLDGTRIDPAKNIVAKRGANPGFADPARGDFRLARRVAGVVDTGPTVTELKLPPVPGAGPVERALRWAYRHPQARTKRRLKGRPDLGAYELR